MRQAENEEDAYALKNHLKSIDFAKKKATVAKTEETAKGGKK
jgi:signal recognition particle GTPase